MDKTILVIGDVTRNQYQPIRLDFLRQGHRPKIVRVTVAEFFLESWDINERYPAGTPADDSISAAAEEYDSRIAQHIKSFGTLAAIVIDARLRSLSILHSLGPVDDKLQYDGDIDMWCIEDGRAQFIRGSAYPEA